MTEDWVNMSTTRRHLNRGVGIILFWVIFAGIFLAYSQGVFKYCSDNTLKVHGSYNRGWINSKRVPEGGLDAVMLGDSECYSAISPMQLWNEYGVTSFNYAQSGQKIQETYFMLRNVFDNSQPKVVFLETNLLYRKQNRLDMVQSSLDELASYVIPGGGVRLHDTWKVMCGQAPQKTPEYKGFYLNNKVKASKYFDYMDKDKKRSAHISRTVDWYTDRIIELCKENGAELILISTPSTRNWNYTRHEVTEDFAAGKGITYIDLNTIDKSELNIDWNTDTKDGGDHLNVSGAQRVTEWFGRYIDKNYDFADKRQDADYSEWNSIYDEYNGKITPMINKIRSAGKK